MTRIMYGTWHELPTQRKIRYGIKRVNFCKVKLQNCHISILLENNSLTVEIFIEVQRILSFMLHN